MKLDRMEHDVEHLYRPPASGESFNHTFKPPPKAQRSAAHNKVSTYTGPLEIDIYNFEDPQFANSKYVLTSPKSLEACCRLNTKPVELLHKTFEDIQKELKDSGLDCHEIYERYSKHESQRQEIIQQVRSIRQTIILDDSQLLSTPASKASLTSGSVKKSKSQNTAGSKRSSRRTIRTPPTGGTSVRPHSATTQHRRTNPSMVVDNRLLSANRCTSKDKVQYPNNTPPSEAQLRASNQVASEALNFEYKAPRSMDHTKNRSLSVGRGSTTSRSTRSCSGGSSRPRAPWVGYIKPHTPVYIPEIGPIHTLYVAQPACKSQERVRHGSSSMPCSSCSNSACTTPDCSSVTMMTDGPKKDATVEQMMSQLEYTLKFAPGCQRGEGNTIPMTSGHNHKMGQYIGDDDEEQNVEKGLLEGDIPWAYSNASTEQMFRDMEKEVARVSHTRSRLDNFMKKQKGGQADSNYQSYNDVSSIASYSSTRRPSSTSDARPITITNPALCQQLRLINCSSTRVKPHRRATFSDRHSAPVVRSSVSTASSYRHSLSPWQQQQDQKILELMLAKREEQMRENQRREEAHRKWESERERSASAGSVLRRDRRLTVSGDRKRDSNTTPTSRQRPTSIDHRHSRTDMSSGTGTPRSKHLSGASRGSSACSCTDHGTDVSCVHCRTPVLHQSIMLRQQSEEKKQRDAERKKRQEERLQQQKKNQDEYLRLLREEQQRELKRAESAKDVRAQEQQLKTKFRNFVTKKRQEEAISKKLRQESEEKELKKVALAERLEQAEKKRIAIRQQREKHLHRNNYDLHDHLEKTKQKKQQLEMEMEVYRTELQTYLQMQEKRAEELAHEAVLKKKMKAQEGVIEKNSLQRRNLEKLIEQEEEWKAEVEADIAMKETRMKILQMEKDDRIAQSRDLANTSRLLREQLRSHFSMNDLDQLNTRARLESRIHSPTYQLNNLSVKDK